MLRSSPLAPMPTTRTDYLHVLKKRWPAIRSVVDATQMLPRLRKFTKPEWQLIERRHSNEGQERGADALVDTLCRRTDCFLTFVLALEDHQYDTLARDIKSDLTQYDLHQLQLEKLEFERNRSRTVCVAPQPQSPVDLYPSQQAQIGNIAPDHAPVVVQGESFQDTDRYPSNTLVSLVTSTISSNVQGPVKQDPAITSPDHVTTELSQMTIKTQSFDDLTNATFEKVAENLMTTTFEDGVPIPVWKKVANALDLKRGAVRKITNNKNSVEALLDYLNDNGWTVANLSEVLEQLKLNFTLTILKTESFDDLTNATFEKVAKNLMTTTFEDGVPIPVWKKVANALDLKRGAVRKIANNKNSGEAFLDYLNDNGLTVANLSEVLEQLKLNITLTILKTGELNELSGGEDNCQHSDICQNLDNGHEDKVSGDEKNLTHLNPRACSPTPLQVATDVAKNQSQQQAEPVEEKAVNVAPNEEQSLDNSSVEIPPITQLNIPPSLPLTDRSKSPMPLNKTGLFTDEATSDPAGTMCTKNPDLEASGLHEDVKQQPNILNNEFQSVHKTGVSSGKTPNLSVFSEGTGADFSMEFNISGMSSDTSSDNIQQSP